MPIVSESENIVIVQSESGNKLSVVELSGERVGRDRETVENP